MKVLQSPFLWMLLSVPAAWFATEPFRPALVESAFAAAIAIIGTGGIGGLIPRQRQPNDVAQWAIFWALVPVTGFFVRGGDFSSRLLFVGVVTPFLIILGAFVGAAAGMFYARTFEFLPR